jgi:hypothetical protein
MAIAKSHSFTERLLAAVRLDVDVYEEVEADAMATPQAAGVAWSVVAAIVGWLLWALIPYVLPRVLIA